MHFGKVIIANKEHAQTVHELRYCSYCNSAGFSVTNEDEVKFYTQWNKYDDTGVCLLAFDSNGEAISTIRGNVYHSLEELEANSPIFKGNSQDFFSFPVLDLTIGATSPNFHSLGLLSVLRYYMYVLHKHSVKSISGSVVKNSNVYYSLKQFGYKFRELETVMSDVKPNDKWTITSIETKEINFAIKYLKTKYAEQINSFPLIIN